MAIAEVQTAKVRRRAGAHHGLHRADVAPVVRSVTAARDGAAHRRIMLRRCAGAPFRGCLREFWASRLRRSFPTRRSIYDFRIHSRAPVETFVMSRPSRGACQRAACHDAGPGREPARRPAVADVIRRRDRRVADSVGEEFCRRRAELLARWLGPGNAARFEYDNHPHEVS